MSYSFTRITCCGTIINLISRLVIIWLPILVTCQDLSSQRSLRYVEYDQTFQFVEGIYCSYDEFLNNNPSIRNDFLIISKKSKDFLHSLDPQKIMQYFPFHNEKICYVNEVGDSTSLLLNEIWGFSDSEDIYFFKKSRIYRLKQIDVICEAELWDKKYFFRARTPGDDANFADKTWNLGKIVGGNSNVYENSPNPGKFNFLNPRLNGWYFDLRADSLFSNNQFCDQIENIIIEDSLIFNQYQNDPVKYKLKIYKSYRYYLLYCDKHPVIFPIPNSNE